LLKDTVQVNRDVLIQLLEALEAVYGDSCDAIHALRAALADQPQTTHWQGCEEVHPECAARARVVEYPVQEPSDPPNFKYWKNRGYELAPLYTAPPQRKPLTEEYRPKSWSELEQQYQAGCDHCTHPQYCGIRCSVCGRWTDK